MFFFLLPQSLLSLFLHSSFFISSCQTQGKLSWNLPLSSLFYSFPSFFFSSCPEIWWIWQCKILNLMKCPCHKVYIFYIGIVTPVFSGCSFHGLQSQSFKFQWSLNFPERELWGWAMYPHSSLSYAASVYSLDSSAWQCKAVTWADLVSAILSVTSHFSCRIIISCIYHLYVLFSYCFSCHMLSPVSFLSCMFYNYFLCYL